MQDIDNEGKLETQLRRWMSTRISADPAHDIIHVQRVVNLARLLCFEEDANAAVVIPAAWLHDCVTLPKDSPDKNTASRLAADCAIEFLRSIDYPETHFSAIHHAIVAHSFSAGVAAETLEAKVVQDADRLDALGAIGVARVLLVGGALHTSLYDPEDAFCDNRAPDDRRYVLDHFYHKLLNLPALLHTDSARREARDRLRFMKRFLKEMRRELDLNDISEKQLSLL